MKKYFYLFSFIILSLFIAACDETITDPPAPGTGSIYMQSIPAGAQIWVDGTNRNKVTPDSVTGLTPGNHQVTLKLNGYRDTTISVNVTEGFQRAPNPVTLTSTLLVTTATDTIWETIGTTAAQPSGIDLSAGTAVSSQSAAADILYSSSGFVIRSSTSRTTSFFVGSNANINDGTDSPDNNVNGWTDRVTDRETNYFFLYDQDGHFSKMKIIGFGGGGIGDPAWVIVQWMYNNTEDDQRF